MTTEVNRTHKILIVDDVPKNIQVAGKLLQDKGYNISFATNGKEALKLTESYEFDLILLDIMMPEMNGYEVCEKLKESPKTKDIPVIFLSAKTESDDIVKGFQLGAVDYVTKPFQSSELNSRVKTHLHLRDSLKKISEQNTERKELLHVLCHDLATPFNSIISVMDIFADQYKDDENMDMLKKMAENGLQVIGLIRKMRALDEGKVTLEIMPVKLGEMINESQMMIKQKLTSKNIELETDVDENLTVMVEYFSFINSVLNNLLTNAIKFSNPNSKIFIKAEKEGDIVKLSIKDQGIGMPAKLLSDIFDISKATTREGTQNEQGTGFGMPLVKKFVEAYNGQINISSKDINESPDDHGTEIIISLKCEN